MDDDALLEEIILMSGSIALMEFRLRILFPDFDRHLYVLHVEPETMCFFGSLDAELPPIPIELLNPKAGSDMILGRDYAVFPERERFGRPPRVLGSPGKGVVQVPFRHAGYRRSR